jgi:hypothetical protein
MRRPMLALSLAALILLGAQSVAADTGTYRIVSYAVNLTLHSDGSVAMEYYQKWLVTGGHIPWVTVGTPNGDFTITNYGGAVGRIASASQGGWSGVRLDLDRDYRPGQTFEVRFAIVQRGLFYAANENYVMDFTPGWYDRAPTDTLRVGVRFFASLETVTASPRPSRVSGDEMIWERQGLLPGQRFSIHVSFPVGLFPGGIAKVNLKRTAGAGESTAGIIVAFIVVAFVIFFVAMAMRAGKRRYSGGRMFYGGFFGGLGGGLGGGRSGGGRSTGGGGGFGGASMSCACACVSCACACACAGGGGAGCSRKLEHTCPVCGKKAKR